MLRYKMGSLYFSKRLRVKEEKREKARGKRSRPKSFNSEEIAKKYAESKGVKDYVLENMATAKKPKIRIVAKK